MASASSASASATSQPARNGLSKTTSVTPRTPTSEFTAPIAAAKSAKRTLIGETRKAPHLPPTRFVLPTASSALITIIMPIITARLLLPLLECQVQRAPSAWRREALTRFCTKPMGVSTVCASSMMTVLANRGR